MDFIYHITSKISWKNAQDQGQYTADSVDTEGFMHCSTQAQLVRTANRFFQNQTGLIILCIEPERVKSSIKYEPAEHDLFPHIYGSLNIDAVTQIIDLIPSANGLFELPEKIENKK